MVRSARTCEPIAASSETPSEVGAEDPVVRLVSFRRLGRDACFDGRGIEEPRERDWDGMPPRRGDVRSFYSALPRVVTCAPRGQ